MTGPGSGGEDYPAALEAALNIFETALVDRWHRAPSWSSTTSPRTTPRANAELSLYSTFLDGYSSLTVELN